MNEAQKKILRGFYQQQCDEHDGSILEDEFTPVMIYKHLEKVTGIRLGILKVEVIELRNMGLIELVPAVDQDYIPSGSGYTLTSKGHDTVINLFLKKDE